MTNYIKNTRTAKGRGVYAGRQYHKGEVIEISPVVAFQAKYSSLPLNIYRILYDWEGTGKIPTSAIALGHGSLFNHDNPANMRFKVQYKKKQITYIAVRDIALDEELTINYNSENGESEWPHDTWFDEMGIKRL